jgi:hypothetical protein
MVSAAVRLQFGGLGEYVDFRRILSQGSERRRLFQHNRPEAGASKRQFPVKKQPRVVPGVVLRLQRRLHPIDRLRL